MNCRQINMLRAACPFINEELRPLVMTFLSFYEFIYYSHQINKPIDINKALSGPIINDYTSLIGALKKNATGDDVKTFENLENMMQMITIMNMVNEEGTGSSNDNMSDLLSDILSTPSQVEQAQGSEPIYPNVDIPEVTNTPSPYEKQTNMGFQNKNHTVSYNDNKSYTSNNSRIKYQEAPSNNSIDPNMLYRTSDAKRKKPYEFVKMNYNKGGYNDR